MHNKNILFRNKYYFKCLEEVIYNIGTKINFAIIKGDILSVLAYKTVNARYYNDIDLLVSRNNLKYINSILNNLRYKQYNYSRKDEIFMLSSSHQTPCYYNDVYNITLDLNFDIFWGEYEGKRINIDEFLSDTIEMEVYGVKVKSLPPIKAMIQLILHNYKDLNSIFLLATRKCLDYNMFKDVYYLLKNNLSAIPLDKFYIMSSEYEIIPYVFYVIYYTAQLFNDENINRYVEAFRTSEGEDLLNCYGLCAKERKEWKCDFKTRLDSKNLYEIIKEDLTEKDKEKIAINKRIFLGISE